MKTVIVELHGFRKDYISKKSTPYLHNLKSNWGISDSKPTLGPHVYPSTLTGTYPNKHTHFFKFSLINKDKTNFRKITPKVIYNIFLNFFRILKGYTFLTTVPHDIRVGKFNIDKKHNNFYPNAFKVFSVFDYFRKNNIPFYPNSKISKYTLYYIFLNFYYSNVVRNDIALTNLFVGKLKKSEKGVFFHILLSTDTYGHKYGPKSSEITKASANSDKCIKKILTSCSKSDNILIFSNYGMLPINNEIDLESKLPKWGKDYYYFLDSNYARFWFMNNKIKSRIINILKRIKGGHIITKEETKKYHIDFNFSRFGEIIFIVDPKTVIFPNFFDKKAPKGLHSYDLKNKKEHGFIISNRKIRKKGNIVDIAPTILDLANVKYSKKSFDGLSMLK